MERVQIVAENEGFGSKQAAEAAWRAWPRLSPDFWRESLGETVGKLWALRGHEEALEGWLATPDGQRAGLNGTYGPDAPVTEGVAVVEVADIESFMALKAKLNGASVVWRAPPAAGLRLSRAMMRALEEAVREGVLPHYGLAGASDLGAWLALAVETAEQVWGRKKRPGLRMVVVRGQPYDLGAWVEETTVQQRAGREEAMSEVELATRLGWRVLVEDALCWQVPQVGRVEVGLVTEAVAAQAVLMALVAEEERLNREMAGWPTVRGVPVWSALRLVANGSPVWATRDVWRRWVGEVLPTVRTTWQQVAGNVAAYLNLLERLAGPEGEALAAWGEQQLTAALVAPLRQRLGPVWAEADDVTVVLGMMASLPGVHGVLVAPATLTEERVRGLQARPDVADVYAVVEAAGG